MTKINIVVSRYKRDTSWLNRIQGDVELFVYDKECPENRLNIPINKGNEASVYLKYIADNYDNLTDYTFFIHDEEYSWHHSGSITDKFKEAIGKPYYNINDKCLWDMTYMVRRYHPDWLDEFLGWYKEYVEDYVSFPITANTDWTYNYRGSAQFMVHRDRIHLLPKIFYRRLYDWILTTNIGSIKSGRFLEWIWHIIWDKNPALKI